MVDRRKATIAPKTEPTDPNKNAPPKAFITFRGLSFSSFNFVIVFDFFSSLVELPVSPYVFPFRLIVFSNIDKQANAKDIGNTISQQALKAAWVGGSI